MDGDRVAWDAGRIAVLLKVFLFFLVGGAALSRHWQPAALAAGVWLLVEVVRRGKALLNAQ